MNYVWPYIWLLKCSLWEHIIRPSKKLGINYFWHSTSTTYVSKYLGKLSIDYSDSKVVCILTLSYCGGPFNHYCACRSETGQSSLNHLLAFFSSSWIQKTACVPDKQRLNHVNSAIFQMVFKWHLDSAARHHSNFGIFPKGQQLIFFLWWSDMVWFKSIFHAIQHSMAVVCSLVYYTYEPDICEALSSLFYVVVTVTRC